MAGNKKRAPAPRASGPRPRRLGLRGRIAVLTIILGVLSLGAATPARQAIRQKRLLDAEEQQLVALRRENARLQQRLERLSDPDHLEKRAREELGVVKPGEIAYVIDPPPPPVRARPAPAPKPWYRDAWNWATGTAGPWIAGKISSLL
ncbi:MAG: FtsB family cell division protein [Actinomycetota bacterium]